MKKFGLILLLAMITSCVEQAGRLAVKNLAGAHNPPTSFDLLPMTLDEDEIKVITLSYTDPNQDHATNCTLYNLNNIVITQACACDALGVCSVGISSSPNYYGAASFSYSVTADGLASNLSTAEFNFTWLGDDAFYQGPLFTTGSDADYSFDSNSLEIAGNLVRLKASDQTDDSSADWAQGTSSGVVFETLADGVTQVFKLGDDGNCDGYASNCSELDSSWAPEWDNIVGYWKLNESNGATTAIDSGPVGTNSGTMTAVGLGVTNRLKTAGDFNGSTSKIMLPNSNTLLPGDTSFTLMAWFKTSTLSNNTANGGDRIVTINQGSGSTKAAIGISGDNTNNVMACGSGCNLKAKLTGITINDNKWHMLVGVYDSTTDIMTVYLDNAGKTSTNVGTLSSSTTHKANIGIGADYTLYPFDGSIDEVAIWNVPLSEDQVHQIYSRQSAKFAGSFASKISDTFDPSSTLDSLTWISTLPFLKPLPDNSTPTPISEAQADYSSLVDSALMEGIVGLWHFDEVSATAGVGNDFQDTSGLSHHAESNGTTSFANYGQFDKSVYTDGSTGYIDLTTLGSFGSQIGQSSVSLWAKTLDKNATVRTFLKVIDNSGFPTDVVYGIEANRNCAGTAETGTSLFYIRDNANKILSSTISTAIYDGKWHHIFWRIIDAATNQMEIYIDGILQSPTSCLSQSPSSFNDWTQPLTLGSGNNRGAIQGFLKSHFDELAIWNRPLTPEEIVAVYRRGANRIKYQMRACSDSTCSSNPTWLGPDGTKESYFSELNNTTNNALGESVLQGLPNFTLNNFGAPFTTNFTASRYFQYRMILESDDETTNCDYNLVSDTHCSPEIISISTGPAHYSPLSPSISSLTALNFYDLSNFTEVLGSSCTGGVVYNLSPNSSDWYWWDSSKASDCISAGTGAWCAANGAETQANSANIVNSNIASFGTAVSSSLVYTKAFLKSNGLNTCELGDIFFTGTR
jgi:hypothetical protein